MEMDKENPSQKKAKSYQDRNVMLSVLKFESYQEYGASDLWASIRQRVFIKSGKICDCCGRGAIQVHHVYYTIDNLSGNSLDGLVPICCTCHSFVEFMDGKKLHDLPMIERRYFTYKNSFGKRKKKAKRVAKRKLAARPKKQTKKERVAEKRRKRQEKAARKSELAKRIAAKAAAKEQQKLTPKEEKLRLRKIEGQKKVEAAKSAGLYYNDIIFSSHEELNRFMEDEMEASKFEHLWRSPRTLSSM